MFLFSIGPEFWRHFFTKHSLISKQLVCFLASHWTPLCWQCVLASIAHVASAPQRAQNTVLHSSPWAGCDGVHGSYCTLGRILQSSLVPVSVRESFGNLSWSQTVLFWGPHLMLPREQDLQPSAVMAQFCRLSTLWSIICFSTQGADFPLIVSWCLCGLGACGR